MEKPARAAQAAGRQNKEGRIIDRNLTYDVAVVGAGASGVAAAIGAAQCGAKVLLLERSPYLGGEATRCMVPAYCGFCTNGEPHQQVVRGVGQLVLDKLRELGKFKDFTRSATGNMNANLDPEATKYALDLLLRDYPVDVLCLATVIGAEASHGQVKKLECLDDEGRFFVTANAFVDASGDANLAYLAGAPVEAHCEQNGTMMFRLGGMDDVLHYTPKDFADGMDAALQKALADGWTGISATRGSVALVEGTNTGLVNIISIHAADLSAKTLSEAEREGRHQSQVYTKALQKYMPGMEKVYLISSGPHFGLRESRRIVGEYTLVREDVKTSRKTEQGIARGGWGAEIHIGNDAPEFTLERGAKYFDIPIGTLRPQGYTNLWCAGRTIASDLTASASIRVMGTGFATGHAAGIAAALSQGRKDYDVRAIRGEIVRQGGLV